MITEKEKPVWYDYLELDENLNQTLMKDTPPEIVEAYERHLAEIREMTEDGVPMFKA